MFAIFQGGGPDPLSTPSLDPRILILVECAAISNVSVRISGVTTLCP